MITIEIMGKILLTKNAVRIPRVSIRYPISGAEKIEPRARPV